MAATPAILVYDSGLGGLSVMGALAEALPDASFVYVADTAGFPYGGKTVEQLHARADTILTATMRHHAISMCVIACNTLSTLCLSGLRARYASLPFVGTVPAIKVAAAASHSGRFSLLATPGAAASAYITELVTRYAPSCHVDRIGAPKLAMLCEAALLGEAVQDAQIAAEIRPAFFDDAAGRTDCIVLGCTHYPFLLPRIRTLAPWEVTFIDPAPAIARQAHRLWPHTGDGARRVSYVTDALNAARYAPVFAQFGFAAPGVLA